MVEATSEIEEATPPEKRRGKGILVALAGSLVAGGIGFFVSFGGLLDGVLGGKPAEKTAQKSAEDFAFVPLDSMIVSLGPEAQAENLKFTAQLEVEPGAEAAVAKLAPRILDVLNSFLRAVEERELQDPASLALLRAQMLRRIQIVVGDDQVRDLLILEFVLN